MGRLLIVAVVGFALAAAGCGSDHDHMSNMSSGDSAMSMDHAQSGGQPTAPMFTAQMIPHHQAAIDMAALAPSRAEHPEIKQLAAEIASAQASEIKLMSNVAKQNNWDPNAKMDHSAADGMSQHEMGMDMDVSKLKTAKPFDKAFIEMMVPHHEGAIRMASHELKRGSNPEITDLAKRITASQTAQIKQMKQWYQAWYHRPLD
jgi:uncharacterized protein (DUF305 family)